jgi:hypothetical protein
LAGEVAIRRRDDAPIDLPRPCVADRHDLALLEHAQELRLHRARHLADLVEEDRALLGGFEGPRRSWIAPVKEPRRWPKLPRASPGTPRS